jgi:hypothetical protein
MSFMSVNLQDTCPYIRLHIRTGARSGRALNTDMKALLASLLLAVAVSAHAQPRIYPQAELDALLAPIALYPDPLLSQVLVAATYPDDVREAAAWSRANAHLKGDEALRAADALPWDPSIKALLAYPDLLARMDESPQWTADLGAAFLAQEPQVMETVQALRQRAQASGFLQSDGYQSVQQQSSYIVVQPVHSHVVYLPWYNPLVVYGPWWWHSHRPFMWRPWHPRPAAFVSLNFHHRPVVDWHRRHVTRAFVHRPVQVRRPVQVNRPANIRNQGQRAQTARPIVQGAQIQPRFGVQENRSQFRREHRSEPRREHRTERRGAVQVRRPVQARIARPIVQGAQLPRFGEQRSQAGRGERGHARAEPRQHSRGNARGNARGRN